VIGSAVNFQDYRETYIPQCDAAPGKIKRENVLIWEGDVKLVQFEDAYGKETYINADRVKYLSSTVKAQPSSTLVRMTSSL
jgi:hypothetical protein